MAKEEVYNAVVNAMGMYGGLFNATSHEIGLEKALELHAKQGENLGTMIGGTLKQKLGDMELDMETFKAILQPMYESFGIEIEYDVSPKSMLLKAVKCPFYAGFSMAGIDHDTISKMCSAMSNAELSQLKAFYPKLESSVKFRETPDDHCEEEFVLK